jgi:capsid protein
MAGSVLDQYGNAFPSSSDKALGFLKAKYERALSRLSAQYDVSQTTNLNSQHWSFAIGGDANIAFDFEKRRKSRQRARYECANSAYLRGMVETRSGDVVGDGPSLHMLTPTGRQEIEKAWRSWADAVQLTDKLVTLWGPGKMTDGEGMALLVNNRDVPHEIQLDLMLFESEQLGNPGSHADTNDIYDGIKHVRGRPRQYYVYDEHPDSYAYPHMGAYKGKWYDSDRVIHAYKRYRVGQLRGATELGPTLELSAHIRRYTLASISAAEMAAEISLWLETDGSPEDTPTTYDGQNFDMFPMARNMVVTAPYGWKAHQMKSEQPVDTFDVFLRSMVTQMGQALGMPACLSFGDSSDYNMASGRLDVQAYIRSVQTERCRVFEPSIMAKIFLAWMKQYAAQRSGIAPSDIDIQTISQLYPHRWGYRPINHSDPEKQANSDIALYDKGLMTMDDYLHDRNIDPESHRDKLLKQTEWLKKAGLPLPGVQPGMQMGEETGANTDE